MPDVYIVKAVTDEYPSQPIPGVFDELVAGRARFGWSYQDTLDLRLLRRKLEGGGELDEDEQRARRCLGFLTRVNVDDYLLYPHQPERDTFTVVQVKGDYHYSEPSRRPKPGFQVLQTLPSDYTRSRGHVRRNSVVPTSSPSRASRPILASVRYRPRVPILEYIAASRTASRWLDYDEHTKDTQRASPESPGCAAQGVFSGGSVQALLCGPP